MKVLARFCLRQNARRTANFGPGAVRVVHLDPDDDPDIADEIAKSVGIRPDSTKEPRGLAYLDNSPVGSVFTGWSGNLFSFDLVVAPEAQRQGVGTVLTNFALRLFAEESEAYAPDGDAQIYLDVVNPHAEAMMARMGLVRVDGNIFARTAMRAPIRVADRRQDREGVPREPGVLEYLDSLVGKDAGGGLPYFVHFGEIEKVGLNPKQDYGTPFGIYAYPLTRSVLSDIKSGTALHRINPEARVFVLRAKNPKKIAVLRGGPKSREREPPSPDTLTYKEERQRAKSKPPGPAYYDGIMPENSRIVAWTRGLMAKGWEGAYDPGFSVIHENEPEQAVFFGVQAIELLKSFDGLGNKHTVQEERKRQQEYYRDYDPEREHEIPQDAIFEIEDVPTRLVDRHTLKAVGYTRVSESNFKQVFGEFTTPQEFAQKALAFKWTTSEETTINYARLSDGLPGRYGLHSLFFKALRAQANKINDMNWLLDETSRELKHLVAEFEKLLRVVRGIFQKDPMPSVLKSDVRDVARFVAFGRGALAVLGARR